MARKVAELNVCNPFTARRLELELSLCEVLGARPPPEEQAPWNAAAPTEAMDARIAVVVAAVDALVERGRRGSAWKSLGAEDQRLWRECVLLHLFQRYAPRFDPLIEAGLSGQGGNRRLTWYGDFRSELEALAGLETHRGAQIEPGRMIALFFQLRRAFHLIYRNLVGGSEASVRLRASIWESVFTHDLDRYRRVLVDRLDDFATLITGPSGSGKEVVARAVALSRHVPFDENAGHFRQDFTAGFLPLNLAALSPTLVESELFGHRRGAFTGAVGDRQGWLEVCPPGGSVFLDELGETPLSIQVKLLRVLQTRGFQRLGDTATLTFAGKIIAATNRDLGAEIAAGRFREDFYFRLCSDRIETPSLREQITGSRAELLRLCTWVSRRLLSEAEAGRLADDLADHIEQTLGLGYPWPGNFRELEQAARNFLVRRTYAPLHRPTAQVDGSEAWVEAYQKGGYTAARVLSLYCKRVLGQCGGNVEEAARRLDLDRRTVIARVGAVREQ